MVVVRLLLASMSRVVVLVRSRGATFEKTSMRAPAAPRRAQAASRSLVKSMFVEWGEEMMLMVESQMMSLLAGCSLFYGSSRRVINRLWAEGLARRVRSVRSRSRSLHHPSRIHARTNSSIQDLKGDMQAHTSELKHKTRVR